MLTVFILTLMLLVYAKSLITIYFSYFTLKFIHCLAMYIVFFANILKKMILFRFLVIFYLL